MIKLLCSFGGKILPRPSDGILKYVGGETRVITLSHDANFSELTKKVNTIVEGDMVLKYQLIPEDLDALVSVRNDEDVKHMLDEYRRQEKQGVSPRLRTFLLPSKPIIIESNCSYPSSIEIEQRYIDAINGIVRSPSKHQHQQPTALGSPRFGNNNNNNNNNCSSSITSSGYSPIASLNSACSSPKSESPEHHYMVVQEANQILQGSRLSLPPVIHKVRSSPSICGNLNNLQQHYQQTLNMPPRPHHNHLHHNHQYQQQTGHFKMTKSLSRNSSQPHYVRGSLTPPPGGRSSESGGNVRSLIMGGQNQPHHNSGCTSPRHQQHQRILHIGGGGSYGYSDDSCKFERLI